MVVVASPVNGQPKTIDFILAPKERDVGRVVPVANSLDPRELETIRPILDVLASNLPQGYYRAQKEYGMWTIRPLPPPYVPSH